MPLSSNALVTLGTLKSELGITGTSDDALLERYINVVSGRIERFCNRSLYYVAAQVDSLGGPGTFYLLVTRPPLLSITSITFDGETVDSSDYELDDSEGGVIRGVNAWTWTAGQLNLITQTPLAGTERKLIDVTYAGGYVTDPQSRAIGTLTLTGQPSDSETFALHNGTFTAKTSGASTNEFNIGTTVEQTCDNIVAMLVAGSESSNIDRAERVGQTVQITWGVSGVAGNSVVFTTALTNTTADGSGTLGGTQTALERTLPYEIEDAAIQLVTIRKGNKGKSQNVKSRKLLSHAETYWGTTETDQGLPVSIASMLRPHKRLGQA
jgi:hypothetical protein